MKKIITGYENYEIYDNGDVFNTTTQKMLKGSISEHGYRYYRLSKDGVKNHLYAHRLVAQHFLDNPNNLTVVNHIDGNKLNNNVSNLEWVTHQENTLKWHNETRIEKERARYEKYNGDLEGEEWKVIPDKDNYKISSFGRVWNTKTNNILHPSITCGYHKVRLCQDGKTKDYLVHHLVYCIFNNISFDEKDRSQVIDHIDGDKLNNCLSNLRKISLSENVNAAYYTTKTNQSCKVVIQLSLQGEYIAEFPSVREAARVLNLDSSTISKVCRGQNKTHGGFIFKYKD